MKLSMSRRSLFLGAAAVGMTAAPVLAADAPAPGGCLACRGAFSLRGGDRAIVSGSGERIRIRATSGDPSADRFLGVALRRLAMTFEVSPGFAFFDDEDGENAVAMSASLLPDGVGTVLMGQRLFARHMAAGDDGMTVIAICAHEFAHIHQLHRPYRATLAEMDRTARPIELHADFLAGYFLAQRKKEISNLDLQNVGRTFHGMGDRNFESRGHHGTSEERTAAISAGYEFGRAGAPGVSAAAAAGIRTVARMVS